MATKPKNNTEEKQTKKIYCSGCDKYHAESRFYKSYNDMYRKRNNRMPICKDFVKKESKDMNGTIQVELFKEILRQMDAPFLIGYWNYAISNQEKTKDIIGGYFRMLSLKQNSGLRWEDSVFEEDESVSEDEIKVNKDALEDGEKYVDEDVFVITKEIRRRWGENYNKKQLMDLEKFYNDMKMTHTIVTPQHVKALTLLCKMQLKLDIFLEDDNMTQFSKLHGEYQKLLQSSGLRPIDKVGGDEATGMRSFSHIFEEVEKLGYIKPKVYKAPQDIIDYTIMYIENSTRKLVGREALGEQPLDTPKVKDITSEYFDNNTEEVGDTNAKLQ